MPVYKDKKRNTWYVSTYVEYRDGTKKRKVKRGFKTKRDALVYERELQFESAMESSDNIKMSELFDMYLDYYKQRMKPSSQHKMSKSVNNHFRPYFEDKRVKDLTKRDMIDFQNYLLDKLSKGGAKGEYSVFTSILNYAKRMEYIVINVASEVGNIKVNVERDFNYWTIDEFKQFINRAKNIKYRAMFMLLFFSGARIGEVLALQWKDIDFDNNTIDIYKTANNKEIQTPKTRAGTRAISIPQHTINAISELKLSNVNAPNFYVFGDTTPLTVNSVRTYFFRTIEQSGVNRIRIHDLRHSHASYLINKGFDIQIISKRLGHSKTSMTYDVYGHLYPNKEDEAIEVMEKEFGKSQVIELKLYHE